MLRFDVPPVHANATRLDAVITFLVVSAVMSVRPDLVRGAQPPGPAASVEGHREVVAR